MASKTRLANKTIWALEDILACCMNATTTWNEMMDYAERRNDTLLAAKLGRMRDHLGRIERTAGLARRGEYWEERAR